MLTNYAKSTNPRRAHCSRRPQARHRLMNETSEVVVFLEVGDRSLGDEVFYPDEDLKAVLMAGQWTYQHKDGAPY